MAQDILTAKIAHSFDLLDADGDGRLTEHDHILMGRRAAAALGHRPGSPEEARITTAYTRIWNDLHRPLVAAGEDHIGKEAFIASTRSLAGDPDAAETTLGALARVYLSVADADGSGDVTVDEFAVFQRSHFPDLTQDDIDKAFAHLDRDGSGRLTPGEFTGAILEYYTSTDPDAPGNWFMGRPVYER
ncbi:MAG TPA: EF-hand domain-containing protein [Glycomyces sp.]|nr:EF-hand domain-containing protein [Glycomyces sp.]